MDSSTHLGVHGPGPVDVAWRPRQDEGHAFAGLDGEVADGVHVLAPKRRLCHEVGGVRAGDGMQAVTVAPHPGNDMAVVEPQRQLPRAS